VNGDGTHQKKQRHELNIYSKGATPIEKNIIVVDEQGNQYEATYPKRAKGLVKNGRARFIDEHTICLACPPQTETEDKSMSENTVTTEATTPKYTVEYILEQIEKISVDNADLQKAIQDFSQFNSSNMDVEQTKLVTGMIMAHEMTNQKIIAFYREMYRDLVTAPLSGKELVASQLLEILRDPEMDVTDKDRAKEILKNYMLP